MLHQEIFVRSAISAGREKTNDPSPHAANRFVSPDLPLPDRGRVDPDRARQVPLSQPLRGTSLFQPLGEGFGRAVGAISQERDDPGHVPRPRLGVVLLPVPKGTWAHANLPGYFPLKEAPVHPDLTNVVANSVQLGRIALFFWFQ